MGAYAVHATDTFKRLLRTLDANEQRWIEKAKCNLEENPRGKILAFSWFREKKFLNKRLLYLVDEESKKILLVVFASKKDQQQAIDFVRANMAEFLAYLKKL
ncbi:hypothetical protein HY491_01305 [Candidatus Woesearchaeota archaeon]|nr:hypothetical protein [Candidatus Woesearchaeota archaeon]